MNPVNNKTQFFNVDYEVIRERETPEQVMDELQFDVLGTEVQPDTDIMIYNRDKPKGIISCKISNEI